MIVYHGSDIVVVDLIKQKRTLDFGQVFTQLLIRNRQLVCKKELRNSSQTKL